MTAKSILRAIEEQGNRNITITGGEPMIQNFHLEELIYFLINDGYIVSVETNGSIVIPDTGPWAQLHWVIDFKMPSSGMYDMMKIKNFQRLDNDGIVKFVIKDGNDFDTAVEDTERIQNECIKNINDYPIFAFSPCYGGISSENLAQWMMKTQLLKDVGAVFSLQLHKIIGVS